jgi:hypothetical protein
VVLLVDDERTLATLGEELRRAGLRAEERAASLGVCAIVPKPIDRIVLARALERALGSGRGQCVG